MKKSDKIRELFAFILVTIMVATEYLHLLFEDIVHGYYMRNGEMTVIYLSDMVYYFTNELLTLFLIIIAFFKIGTNKKTKVIMASACFWYIIEFIEITLQLMHISDARLFINDGSWIQLSTCIFVALLILFGNKKTIS